MEGEGKSPGHEFAKIIQASKRKARPLKKSLREGRGSYCGEKAMCLRRWPLEGLHFAVTLSSYQRVYVTMYVTTKIYLSLIIIYLFIIFSNSYSNRIIWKGYIPSW